jgi:hypothetical protein
MEIKILKETHRIAKPREQQGLAFCGARGLKNMAASMYMVMTHIL